jgi:hypothetical protein
MKIRIETLSGINLDLLVAKALGYHITQDSDTSYAEKDGSRLIIGEGFGFSPSTDWVIAGPIIEREKIHVGPGDWDLSENGVFTIHNYFACTLEDAAHDRQENGCQGQDYLEAAMRCFAVSKLGQEIEVFQELKTPEVVEVDSQATFTSFELRPDPNRYGSDEHQAFGDAYLYHDCPGAW